MAGSERYGKRTWCAAFLAEVERWGVWLGRDRPIAPVCPKVGDQRSVVGLERRLWTHHGHKAAGDNTRVWVGHLPRCCTAAG
ncbi:hypothetical protein MPNT_150002 [Candidatus Methylacidithermus pantelleriae]|uniref:Uncharacterized protein n=1 Tax=Candidatus Methylacidithermus pantelleriae TaxID=2744239 RepID=A0A8J2BJS9_9BACT|nr:hypothetical protein MPNT_150002 [Candidatus Methylacidithermus pantelleriae]